MFPYSSPKQFQRRQKKIRDHEWEAWLPHLKRRSGKFLDVGCGTLYAVRKAADMGFEVNGIEPDPGFAGVTVEAEERIGDLIIGRAEQLPYGDDSFDVVYSSHSLEHWSDRQKGLAEVTRVAKGDGLIVLVVPTGTMALVNTFSRFLFDTHIRIGRWLLHDHSARAFAQIFMPGPHGEAVRTSIGEARDFAIPNWRKLLQTHFEIKEEIQPALHPYPDWPPLFPTIRFGPFSSSVIFVCAPKSS